jgi:hypothetical protein
MMPLSRELDAVLDSTSDDRFGDKPPPSHNHLGSLFLIMGLGKHA